MAEEVIDMEPKEKVAALTKQGIYNVSASYVDKTY